MEDRNEQKAPLNWIVIELLFGIVFGSAWNHIGFGILFGTLFGAAVSSVTGRHED